MSDPSIVANFEQLLKKKHDAPSPLYKTTNLNNTSIKSEDLLHCVYSQIKYIQQADGRRFKRGESVKKGKSTFLAVHMLPQYTEVPQHLNPFDTECVSNTQLINMIEDAEALNDTHNGITQEFDNAFTHTNVNNSGNAISLTQQKTDRDIHPVTHEYVTSFTQTSVDKTVTLVETRKQRLCVDLDLIQFDVSDIPEDVTNIQNVNTQKEMYNELYTYQFEAETIHCDTENIETHKEIENIQSMSDNTDQNETIQKDDNAIMQISMNIEEDNDKRSPSPIFILKSKTVPSFNTDQNETIQKDDNAIMQISMNIEEDNDKRSPSPIFILKSKTVPSFNTDQNETIQKDDNAIMQISMNIEEDNDKRSPSPIFILKSKTGPSSLKVPQSTFESFEKAMSLLDINENFETYKHLINSQISGGQLCLNTDEEVMVNKNGQLRTIEENYKTIQDMNQVINNLEESDKQSNSFKDEILFSSDEEDFILSDFTCTQQLTADLEKSCRKHSELLEENMYVGFQTASHKSIKISTESYKKASFILDKDDTKRTDLSLVEPVEMSDEKSLNNIIAASYNMQAKINAESKPVVDKFVSSTDLDSNKNEKTIKDDEIKIPELTDYNYAVQEPPEKQSFVGFETANNKKIYLSDKGLDHIKMVFKDIDFDDKFDVLNQKTSLDENGAMSSHSFKTADNKTNITVIKTGKINDEIDINIENQVSILLDDMLNNIIDEEISQKLMIANEIFENLGRDYKEAEDQNSQPSTSKSAFLGFKTASNKDLQISDVALLKSSNTFKDIDKESTIDFKTASNKNVKISQQASNNLIDIKSKIIEDSKETTSNTSLSCKTANNKAVLTPKEVNKPYGGFKTASNKNVNISKQALAKCRNIFGDLNDITIENDEVAKESTIDFKTASNMNVKIYKQASNNLIDIKSNIIEDSKENTSNTSLSYKTANKKAVLTPKEVNKPYGGFKTASNKNVNISKQALAKCRNIFGDLNDITIGNDEVAFVTANKQADVSETTTNIFKDMPEITQQKTLKEIQTASKEKDLNIVKTNILNEKAIETNYTLNLDINTQVINDFEESLHTEDFKETTITNERSASPIISCARPKKRKIFETPYRDITIKMPKNVIKTTNDTCKNVKFTENFKKNKIYKLKDLKFSNGDKTNVDPYITKFNLENILDFEFSVQRNDVTDNGMSIKELKKIFSSAVNTNLVPDGWLDNHIKLILWKLLSYEVKFSNTFCTVQNVLDQLKYRYNKELYNAERPALRKILEKDDIPAKTMILCVAGIYIDGISVHSATNTKDVELLLTDGWYFIKASIDKMVTKLIHDRRIVIGCKIITSGAELINCEQGISPWEDTSAVRLKIFGNSTRPASWDSILGFIRAAILCQLSTVQIDGGKICRLKAFVTRVYPLLYIEKFEDGSTVTRSERLEHLHQMKYEAERELMIERIYEEVQKEFRDQASQDSDVIYSGKRKYYDNGSQIAKKLKTSSDPMEFREQLTNSQVNLLQEYTCKYQEKILQVIQDRIQERVTQRKVVALARGRIASLNNKMEVCTAMLSVWKPNEAILDIFKEGSCIDVMNIVPTAKRYSEIQITAGRQAVFRPTKFKSEHSDKLKSLKRTCFKLSDVAQNPTMTSDYNEIDTVGIVFLIEPNNQEFESSRSFQNVYLADADKNMIIMNFWGGIKKFGYENMLDAGQVVACANLQKRAGNTEKNIPQFRVTEFTHFTKSPKNAQMREMVHDLQKKMLHLYRTKFCEDCIVIKNNFASIRCLNNSENESPRGFHVSGYSISRNK